MEYLQKNSTRWDEFSGRKSCSSFVASQKVKIAGLLVGLPVDGSVKLHRYVPWGHVNHGRAPLSCQVSLILLNTLAASTLVM